MDKIDIEARALFVWVIYDSPIDLPGRFVARKWRNGVPTLTIEQAQDLDDLRAKLPTGLMRFGRQNGDDPKIVECWL